MSSIETEKIPGEMNDRVKLCTYLSPGDLLVLWTSFKTVCAWRLGKRNGAALPRASHGAYTNGRSAVWIKYWLMKKS